MIRKALIPIAGLGTRMGVLARAVPKAMFPLVGADGRIRPVVQCIIDEAMSAGVEQVGLIVSPAQVELLRTYFDALAAEDSGRVRRAAEFIVQPSPEGFGEAVARGAKFAGDEPFMLLLGDHVYKAAHDAKPCAAQVADAFAWQGGAAMIGMQTVGPEELPKVGTAGGEPIGPETACVGNESRIYVCRRFIEKPSIETARHELRTPGLGEDQYLAHCGIYVLTSEIFDCLRELSARPRPAGKEIQLADAQSMLLARHPNNYYLYRIDGRAYDTGTPGGYLATQKAIAGDP
ncbi:MAG: sugar phosphate nucleotidyltransferase [Phycisphaerae bacterium]